MDFLWERVGEIIHQLEARSFMHSYEITEWRGKSGHFPITDRVDADTSDWEIVQPGHLGEHNSEYFAVAATVVIPEEMKGMPVELSVTTGREGEWDATNPQIAAYVNGVLAQGLDINHTALRLTESGKPGEAFQIFMVVYTGERGSIYQWGSRLRSINKTVQGLYYDLLIPWQCLELMEEDSKEYGRLLRILNDTLNILDFRREEAFLASVEKAAEFLKEKTEELPDSDLLVSCIGHTHIDVAWLWTYAITKEKAARSFSTVLNLMNRYPEYQFMSSQAQLYCA